MLRVFYHNKRCLKRFGKLAQIKWLFFEVSLRPPLMGQEKICYIQQGVNFSLNVALNLNNLGANFEDNWEATATL